MITCYSVFPVLYIFLKLETYPVSEKRFHDYHQVSQCELYHRFFLYRFFYLLFSYTYQSDLKEESSNIFHYNCYLQNNSSVVYFVFYFLSNMDPTYPKKAIFDNIKTIPYHLLISTKKVSCTTAKDFFQPDHLYTTYRSVVNFQPDHLYTTYRSVVNFHLYPNNSSQKVNLSSIYL